jgi:HlyD family secretion protein
MRSRKKLITINPSVTMTVRKTIISSVAALLLASAAYAGLSANVFAAGEAVETATPQTPPAIRVVTATKRELVERLSVTGTIISREEAAAGTDLNGLAVLQLNADQGDMVKRGQVLAVLDRSSLDTQLAQMNASRSQAEANIAQMRAQIGDAEIAVRQAQEGLDRARALQEKGVAAKMQYDNAVNGFDSARAKLSSAEKAVAASEAQLAVIDAQKQNILLQITKTEVKAPADGLVLARNATLGGIVSASGGPLFRIAINGEFELAATIAETSLPRLESGMPVEVTPAGGKQPLAGKIRRISPEVDQRSRLGTIYISILDGNGVRAGNFARGEIEAVRRQCISVPASAVTFHGQDAFLQLVESGKVKSVPVTLGARADSYVEVNAGLSEGQEVVARAGTFIADGDLVTPVRGEQTGAIKP